jgi:TolB-like protein/DNA-binding SARP family transcriptional activator
VAQNSLRVDETRDFLAVLLNPVYLRLVNDMSANPLLTAGRFRLRTFGTLALAGPDDDTILGKHRHQHRRLALLAVLAAAGDEGRSRDQLHLLFWPDATQTRARHSLEQLLYAIRGSIGDDVFGGVNPVRLNPAIIGSDVADFQSALKCGDLTWALEQYRGKFLDGFYLSDVPEFEQWMNSERARLERSYSGALERLAQKAEAEHDYASAVHRWRQITDIDGVSSKNAAGLIRALMNAGDHAAALQYAEQYEKVVARELGTTAGPDVARLVAEARSKTGSSTILTSKTPHGPPGVAARDAPATTTLASRLPLRRSARQRFAPYGIGATFVILVIATAAWLRTTVTRPTPNGAEERSIAVLPLLNIGGDRQDGALVDGLSEELIAVLSRIPNLRVIPRTSAFAFKDSHAGIVQIAESLGVSNILEGGVQRDGSKFRVQLRLVNARDGSTRWSRTFDRELKDIFAVQSEIAGAVASELDVQLGDSTLSRIKRGSTRSIAAYELYLRGNDPVLFRSDSGARAALAYYREAIDLDPNYADAYAGLAKVRTRIGFADDSGLSRRERLALAEQAALKAVAIDESSATAHAALSVVRRNNYEFASAHSEMKRAIELEPVNPRFHEWLAVLDQSFGRTAEALAESNRALELDPLSPTATAEVANALLASNRCDEALTHLDKLRSLRPPLLRASAIAAQCYMRKQRWPEAIAATRSISTTGGPRGQALHGYMLGRSGRTEEAKRVLAGLLEFQRTHKDAFDVAIVYAGLGDNDRAFTWLDKAVDDRSLGFEWLSGVFDDLRRDPRFDRLGARVGFGTDSTR